MWEQDIDQTQNRSQVPHCAKCLKVCLYLEEVWQDFVFDVGCLHTIGGAALLDNFQNNLLHFFVGRLELTDQDHHHLKTSGKVMHFTKIKGTISYSVSQK